MYVVKKFATPLLLTKFLRGGDTVFSGTATLTVADATTTLTDDSATDLTDTDNVSVAVAAGMGVYIGDDGAASGDETTIATVGDAATGAIVLEDNIGVASSVSYRIVADGERHHMHGASRNIVHIGFDSLSSTWVVIYDAGSNWSNS